MTKHEANNLLRRIYRALDNKTLKLKISRKIHPWYGSCDIDETGPVITINPLKTSSFWITLVHECLHLVRFEDEEWVKAREKTMFDNLSDKQLTNLLSKVIVWIR